MKYERSLAAKLPELASQWDTSRNDKSPSEVSFSSAYKAWWTCPTCQHSWQASVNNRKNGRGCPGCAGKVVTPGVNDFASQRPEYLSWWDDAALDPSTVLPGSRQKARWRCPLGHTFLQEVRLFKGACTQCATRPILAHSPHLAADWSTKNILDPHEVSYSSAKEVLWECAQCKHEWSTPAYARSGPGGSGCPKCAQRAQSSKAEEEIAQMLSERGLVEGKDFIRNARPPVLGGSELDFYFPQHNLAVEYNGVFFHSEARGKTRNAHYDKWAKCRDNSIQLVYVWEDDYQRNKQLIINMIMHKIGRSTGRRIYARQCSIKQITHAEASEFLDAHHIQGKSPQCNLHLGLFCDGQLVAVSTWLFTRDVVYLQRYATSEHVVGGLGKMLKRVIRDDAPQWNAKSIITFASHDVSNGKTYLALGFKSDAVLRPDYSYLYKGKRVHKFNFRLKRFRDDPDLTWDPSKSESQLAAINGLHKVWDAGKTRFVLEL